MDRILKIGTRGSPLALAQTRLFIALLLEKYPSLETEIVTITTTGDKIQDRPLMEAGGKGLFTKEIEDALLEGSIDCAVHSMKDMPTQLPEGLCIPCLLPREDVRDAFFSPAAKTLDDLPQGATVGTSSLRRQALLLARRPDLKVVTFRGNVGTRLKKLEDGVVDATLLAVAGLKRLGMGTIIQTVLEPDIMLPAVAQGAVGIETRADDATVRKLLSAVHCPLTALRVTAERAFLEVMDGSCRTPIAALLSVPDSAGRARLDALVARPDGTELKRGAWIMDVRTPVEARQLGHQAGQEIKAQLPADYFSA